MKWWALPHYIWEPHVPKNPAFFFPPLFFSSLHPACPSFSSHPTHSMPNSVLRIHLQIKQIYHSVTEAGKGGRLWNALAPGAGKGSEHCAMLPCVLPCCTLLHLLSLILALRAFMIHAVPLEPPPQSPPFQCLAFLLSYLYQPNPTKPSERWPTARNCNTAVPVLTRRPSHACCEAGVKLRPGPSWLTSSSGLRLRQITPCLTIR